MSHSPSPTIEDLISYCPITGEFRWKVTRTGRTKAGYIAGCANQKGYWRVCVAGKNYAGHRLAWYLMTGKWPGIVDHRNLDGLDNRWANLREATPTQNNANCRGRGRFPKGVTAHSGGRYQAQIKKNGRCHYLGLFDTSDAAAEAYIAAAAVLFGEFARAA